MRSRGFTLLELVMVVLLLSIVAGVALLDRGTAVAERRLDVAASEVASALRFARAESLRTGEFHGSAITLANHQLRLFRLDLSGTPPVQLFVVDHPLDRRPYDITLPQAPFSRGVEVASASFAFAASPSLSALAFEASGAPISPVTMRRLLSGQVVLQYAGRTRTVSVAAITGRVTVQ